ncbi:MAG: pyruvate:ferredoxin (flavodoxin) oxidoreductase, partial [Chloroflexota bacterium]
EMQSEAGAAGALHGALQKGALATTFTASQGLLLMIPNMYKIAGELTPAVIHVAARALATHALSIFGDHSDVMGARATGWAMLAAGSVQEVHDLALVAHAATLRSRVPFLHFFDGFRTSHEVDKIALLDPSDLRALVQDEYVLAHRRRGMTPEAPVVRGTAQNPDVFFQAREAANPWYLNVKDVVAHVMAEVSGRTGRQLDLVSYFGAPDAERVVLIMGSGIGAMQETVETMNAAGEKVGVVQVRLFQPFPSAELIAALPETVRSIAVMDRTKEPGAVGEPFYLETVAAIAEAMDSDEPPFERVPRIIGGRYGLSSKEFTPSMIKPIYDELGESHPKRHFTVGIYDDVTGLSLPIDAGFKWPRPEGEVEALFFGLGSDGTVGANKASVKIIGEGTDLFAQGHFVYDSKKSGAVTVSHLRFGPEQIRSTYEIEAADFVACHQFGLLRKMKVLERAKHGSTFLLNSPYGPDEVWDRLPANVQAQLIEKDIDFWVIDALSVATEVGMGNRINTVMQPCFFHLAGVLPGDEAITRIKAFVKEAYSKRGDAVVKRNYAAIDLAVERLVHVTLGSAAASDAVAAQVPDHAPDFVKQVTATIMAGDGDLVPVSALPVDGTFPTGTTKWEKRAIAQTIPVWDETICIDCGKCAIVCPHAAIRMKVYPAARLEGKSADFRSKDFRSRDLPDHKLTIQVAPDDCTGCGVCVDVCPAKSKTEVRHKSINMEPYAEHAEGERVRWEEFLSIPPLDRSLLARDTVKGSQVLEPLFEFSGACAGCGETPYIKLVSQLFGDRMIVANATGCSSIFGGNLPTTPWTSNAEGRGPAWNNSLFEDNAEFGLGMRLAMDLQTARAKQLLEQLAPELGGELVRDVLDNAQ